VIQRVPNKVGHLLSRHYCMMGWKNVKKHFCFSVAGAGFWRLLFVPYIVLASSSHAVVRLVSFLVKMMVVGGGGMMSGGG